MLIKRSTLLFGVFAIFALSACESEKQEQVEVNPTYDPETNTVRTEFVFNVASSAEGQPTKTTAEFVQYNKPFLGMDLVHILAYDLPYSTADNGAYYYKPWHEGKSVAATKDYNLGSLLPAGAVDKDNASRTLELSLPLGTNCVLLYGKALKSYSNDLQGLTTPSGDAANLATLTFSLTPRLTSSAAFEAGAFFFSRMLNYFLCAGKVNEYSFWKAPYGITDNSYGFWWPTPSAEELPDFPKNPDDGDTYDCGLTTHTYYAGELSWKQLGTMYDYDNDESEATLSGEVVKTKNGTKMALSPLGETLGNAYSSLVNIRHDATTGTKELRAGSTASVLRTMDDLYSIIDRAANAGPTSWEEKAAEELAILIKARMEKFFVYTSSGLAFLPSGTKDATVDVEKLKEAIETSVSPTDWEANKSIVQTHLNKDYFLGEGFPLNVGLPSGAAILTSTITPDEATATKVLRTPDTFAYTTDIPAYGMGDASFPITNYRYPPELMYYGNSPIRVSNATKVNFPSSISAWNTDSQWAGWETNAKVKSDTRYVAMITNINYGTAVMASTVKYGSTVLKDNNHNLHPTEEDQVWTVTNDGLLVTGIVVGGQADQVGWDYIRRPSNVGVDAPAGITYDETTKKFTGLTFEGNGFDKMIYDKVTVPYYIGSTAEPIYTMVWDNYDATKPADDQSDVYVGVEVVNNTGMDLWGEMNLIRKGGTFYLLGKMDISTALAAARASDPDAFKDIASINPHYNYPPFNPATGATINAPRVFMQDFMTKANLILNEDALKHAYVTLPDLRSSQVSLGVSIDMEWESGLSFDVALGETD